MYATTDEHTIDEITETRMRLMQPNLGIAERTELETHLQELIKQRETAHEIAQKAQKRIDFEKTLEEFNSVVSRFNKSLKVRKFLQNHPVIAKSMIGLLEPDDQFLFCMQVKSPAFETLLETGMMSVHDWQAAMALAEKEGLKSTYVFIADDNTQTTYRTNKGATWLQYFTGKRVIEIRYTGPPTTA